MTILKGHTEEIQFDLVTMGTHQVVLGMPWLRLHNPIILWSEERIIMNQCQCRSDDRAPLGRNADPGRVEACAASDEPEDLAQASVLSTIPTAYKEYESLFREDLSDKALPKHQPWDHPITLEEGKAPPWGPIYQLSERELKVQKEYIDENLKKGFIVPSKSPAASPMLFVPKPHSKTGELRPCIDYRLLNAITIKDRYALPLIHELQDRLWEATIFTSLDLRGAYNLIRIKAGDEWKTAFRTRYGLFEYRVMPFGLTNAPATFQRMINDQLHEYLDIFVVAYLDDILIYSKTEAEHTEHVKRVLQKLKQAGLLLKPEKCQWHTDELEFLGYILQKGSVSMSPRKVEAVTAWPIPTCVKEVMAFLGFANFYRRFIQGYSKITSVLSDLTKKEKPFGWTQECQAAFEELKRRFTCQPILATFNPNKSRVLETDASDFAIGACLSQEGDDGKLRPVAYYSRKLSAPELNYDVHDKELLAIVAACQQWRVYLEGSGEPIQVWTDHKNLTTFTTSKILNRRQVRWSELLSTLDLRITYRKGTDNTRADALSRRQDYAGGHTERPRAIFKAGEKGLEYNHELLATISVVEDTRLEKQIKANYVNDSFAVTIMKKLGDDFMIDNQGILRFRGLVYIPAGVREQFVREQHSLPAHGHQGIARTWERLARDYYFPGMRKLVEKVVSECDICQRSKTNRHAPYGLLQPPPTPGKAWKSIAFDFIVKLPASKEPMTQVVYDSIWVVTCRTTKYGHFVPYKESSDATELAYAFMRNIVSQHGLPDEIISDRDKLFTSKFWVSLMAQLGAHHKLSTAFHPQTDGQTERLNQTLEQYLRSYVNQKQDDWVQLLPLAEFAYNSAKSEATGVSPFYANYGYQPEAYRQPRKDSTQAQSATVLVTELQQLHQQLAMDIRTRNEKVIATANKKRSVGPPLERGDKVYLLRKNIRTKRPSEKLDFKKVGPLEITEKVGKVNYRLKLPASSKIHPVFHVSLLEPARGNAPVIQNAEIQPVNDTQEYEVETILDTRINKGQREYLIKWEGCDDSENTWEPTKNLNCPQLQAEFHRQILGPPRKKAKGADPGQTPRQRSRGRRLRKL